MSYYVYMLKSIEKKSVTYVGYAKDLKIESAYIIKEKEQNLQEEENGS